MHNSIANPFENPCAGIVAIAPGGRVFGFANSPTALIKILHGLLPEETVEYRDELSEGGKWFSFLRFLANYGMDYLAATPAAMAALKANDHATEFECDKILGYFRIKGESPDNQAASAGS